MCLPRLGAVRKVDEHLLVHLGTEESRLDVHVVNMPFRGRGHREECACCYRPGHWRPRVVKITPRYLVEALRVQARLVPRHVAFRIALDVVHVPSLDSLALVVVLDLGPCTKLLVRQVLFILRRLP